MIFLRINKKCFNALTGIAVGICNGFFGSGGGMIAVPMLEKGGSEAKKAHEKAFKQSAKTYFRRTYDNCRREDIYEIG